MIEGQGFQYVGGQLLRLEEAPQTDGGIGPSAVPTAEQLKQQLAGIPQAPAPVQRQPVAQPQRAQPAPQFANPGDLVKAARQRVKELKQEIKLLKAKQREVAELERLIKAAKQKPAPKVRALHTAKNAG